MFLGILGLLMIIVIVWALIQSKTNPVPIFVIVPIIAAVIAGFGPTEIFKFISSGVGGKTVCGGVQMVAQRDGSFPFVRVRPLCILSELLYQFFSFHRLLLSAA